MRRRARPPVSQKEKIKTFLDERLDQGSDGAYEASQLLRGQVQRNNKQGNFKESLEIGKEGAMALLQRNFVASGTELAMQLVETLEAMNTTAGVTPSVKEEAGSVQLSTCLEYLGAVDDCFDDVMNKHTDEEGLNLRVRVLKRAVKWSSQRQEVGTYLLGHPEIHCRLGNAYFSLAKFQMNKSNGESSHVFSSELGIKHLVLGEQPQLLATQLVMRELFSPKAASAPTMKRERAAAVMRSVFQFIAVENLRDANVLYSEISTRIDAGEISHHPPLALCPVLLKTCEYNAPDMFTELRHRLQNGDMANGSGCKPGSNNALMGMIAQRMFNINPPPNMLSNLLSMFSAGGDDDDN